MERQPKRAIGRPKEKPREEKVEPFPDPEWGTLPGNLSADRARFFASSRPIAIGRSAASPAGAWSCGTTADGLTTTSPAHTGQPNGPWAQHAAPSVEKEGRPRGPATKKIARDHLTRTETAAAGSNPTLVAVGPGQTRFCSSTAQ
ncbi:MAG: hypothetical protein M1823_005239 [Watsoniomyces obsoletus]|nr:MAG: hypothetical protein M1823_005239 [Watsoniomyces obsoletus]